VRGADGVRADLRPAADPVRRVPAVVTAPAAHRLLRAALAGPPVLRSGAGRTRVEAGGGGERLDELGLVEYRCAEARAPEPARELIRGAHEGTLRAPESAATRLDRLGRELRRELQRHPRHP